MNRSILGLCAAAITVAPVAAWAHTGIGPTQGIMSGFSHPFSGLDHVLTMTAVGVFAAQLGGRALWLLPLTFVSVMALAGLAGMAGVALPFVEIGIAISVIVLGLAIALELSVPTSVATALVGLFAIFHGHAHGTEMPESLSGLAYGLGFVCATAVLHAAGIGLGVAVDKTGRAYSRRLVQAGGAAMAVVGFALLISI